MHRVQIQDSMQKGKNSGPIPTLSCNLIIHLSSCFIFELGFVLDVALHYICEVYGICLYQIRAYMHCIKSIYTNLNLTYNTNLTTQNINYNSYTFGGSSNTLPSNCWPVTSSSCSGVSQ